MAAQPTASGSQVHDIYESDVLGGAGEKYSRLLAVRLLSRAAIENRLFKLGIEFKAADKFDDLAFYDEKANEWWLIQTKHSLEAKEISGDAVFSGVASKGDFSMMKYFKSYLHIKQHWQYGGAKVKLFLFTNRPLNESIPSKSVEVDKMLMFTEGKHVQIVPGSKDLKTIVECLNNEVCDALVKLFEKKEGRVINVLVYYTTVISHVLVKDDNKLKFSESFLSNNPRSELYIMLKSAFATKTNDLSSLSVAVPSRFPDFWGDSVENSELPFIDDDSVKAYFNDLILSVSQPNVKRLEEEIKSDWNRWMKSWIRPDVFRRLTGDQLSEAFNTFKGRFSEWEKPHEKSTKRQFLSHNESTKWLEAVKRKLNSYVKQYGRQGCAGLDAAEKYYVNRRIIFGQREVFPELRRTRMLLRTLDKFLKFKRSLNGKSDDEFLQWLDEDWTNRQCITLFAEPGMGKSTLWQHLAFRTQQRHKDVEVYLIFLGDLKEELPPVYENTNVEDAMSILEAVISAEHVTPLLDKNQKVFFFMDAFDELIENNKQSVLNLVKVFKRSRSKVKFLISSRERCREQLEDSLHFSVIDVVPLDETNRRDFLRSFWNAEDDEKFNAYAEVLLKKFERDAPRADIWFIGLPLTMKMLAEVFQGSFKEYLDSTNTIEAESLFSNLSISIIYLYERFIIKCILLSLHRKWDLNLNDGTVAQAFDPQIESTTKDYQLLAMELNHLDHLLEDTHKAQVEKFRDKIRKGLEESLLLETVNGSPQFSHLSYAEFFCASYLLEQLSSSETISRDHLKKLFKRNAVIHIFFLKILDTKLSSTESKPSHGIDNVVKILLAETDEAAVLACEANCAYLLSKLLSARNEARKECRDTLLHVAARSNASDAMKVLLREAGTNIDVENDAKETPLCIACEEGHLDMVKLLVEKGANVNHRLGEFESPLRMAVSEGSLDIIEYLISDTAYINPKYNDNKSIAPLYAACLHLDIVKMLISRGASTDYRDSVQRTALHWASKYGMKANVAVLLDCGANIDARDKNGQTPLHVAARNYYFDVAQLLLNRGAIIDVTNTKRQPVLHFAAFLGLLSVVEERLNSGANVNEGDGSCWNDTPLHAAAAGGDLDVVRLLISRESDLHALNRWNETAQHYAASAGQTAVVEELYECRANVNARVSGSNSPLHVASAKGHSNVVRVLIIRGADVNLTNSANKTALHIAAENGSTAVVEELLKGGADINAQDIFSNTPLDYATNKGHSDIVTLLEAHRDKHQSSND